MNIKNQKISSQNKIVIGYWKHPGKVMPCKYLLEILEVEYEEVNYTNRDDWFNRDKINLGLPFPNLPYIIDGEVKLTESETILDYLLDKYKQTELRGKGNDKYLVDIVRNFFQDFSNGLSSYVQAKDEEEKAKVVAEKLAPKLKYLESFIANKEYLVGGYFTIADIYFYSYVNPIKTRIPGVYKDYATSFDPLLIRFQAIPQISAYISSGRHP